MKVVTIVRFQVILIATLLKSGILKPSLTSLQAPFPSTLLTVFLVGNSGGKLSEVASNNMIQTVRVKLSQHPLHVAPLLHLEGAIQRLGGRQRVHVLRLSSFDR